MGVCERACKRVNIEHWGDIFKKSEIPIHGCNNDAIFIRCVWMEIEQRSAKHKFDIVCKCARASVCVWV